jgi:hypothetical protein
MEKVAVQLKIPLMLNVWLERSDAEWMFRDQLAEVVDAITSQLSTPENKKIQSDIEITGGHVLDVEYRADPYCEYTQDEDLYFTSVEDGLFPFDGVRDDE